MAVAYALALGSKENGVVLPALVIVVTFLAPWSAVGASPAPGSGSVGSTDAPPHRPLLSQWPGGNPGTSSIRTTHFGHL